jgi:hypothetical protein
MTAVERRIIEDRSWWDDYGADVVEWLEMAAVHVCVGWSLIALLTVVELVGPVAYLECGALTDKWTMQCEYRVGH